MTSLGIFLVNKKARVLILFCDMLYLSVLGNHDYTGNALAQQDPAIREVDSRYLAIAKSFIVNSGEHADDAAHRCLSVHIPNLIKIRTPRSVHLNFATITVLSSKVCSFDVLHKIMEHSLTFFYVPVYICSSSKRNRGLLPRRHVAVLPQVLEQQQVRLEKRSSSRHLHRNPPQGRCCLLHVIRYDI